jgi:enoyl-CoA hydratase
MDIGALRRHLKHHWRDRRLLYRRRGGAGFRVMARDGHLRVPEIGLGMNMSWQSVPRMFNRTGPHQAGGDPGRPAHLGGRDLRVGLVEEVADPGKALGAAMALAAKVAAQPPLP